MSTNATAVLIHGLHLEANGWESLVWGEIENGIWGTIPRGVAYAWTTRADLIYWGSGASEREGKKEAQWMYDRALQGIAELAKICGADQEELSVFIKEHSIVDMEVKDTKEEIRACYDLALARGIVDVALVPYASQAPRAIREALKFALEDDTYAAFRHHISMEPSDTRYVGVAMPDVVIFTPPHRGDRVANPSHILARRTLDVIQRHSKGGDKAAVENFMNEWDALLKKFEDGK